MKLSSEDEHLALDGSAVSFCIMTDKLWSEGLKELFLLWYPSKDEKMCIKNFYYQNHWMKDNVRLHVLFGKKNRNTSWHPCDSSGLLVVISLYWSTQWHHGFCHCSVLAFIIYRVKTQHVAQKISRSIGSENKMKQTDLSSAVTVIHVLWKGQVALKIINGFK